MEDDSVKYLVKTGKRKKEVEFNVHQVRKGSSFNKADVVDNCLGNRGQLTCFPMEEKDYRHQTALADINNSNTLKMDFYDKSESIGFVENMNSTLYDWLHQKFTNGNIYADKGLCILYAQMYIEDHNLDKWWNIIESDFKNIFGPVIDGLRSLHINGKYHGNLKNGVVIDNKKKGHLSNMIDRGHGTLEPFHEQDDNDLIYLIKCAVLFPLLKKDASFDPEYLPSNVRQLCLTQLEDWNYLSSRLRKQWDLNPVFFWDDEQTIKLLNAVYWVLFRGNTKLARYIVGEVFVNNDWHTRVKEKHNGNMNDVLNNFTDTTMLDGMNKLRFWRNCMEHMESTDKVLIGNQYSEMHSTREVVHKFLIEVIPELIPETINAVNKLIAWLPSHKKIILKDMDEKDLLSKIKTMFGDMKWSWKY